MSSNASKMAFKHFVFLFLFLFVTFVPDSSKSVVIEVENLPETCDYTKCTAPDSNKINLHLVPHTHDDVGWLKTVDQYYYGSNSEHQKAGVQYILDTVVEELIRDKARRFIYVETAFFWKWWKEQNAQQRKIVHELVRSGQLEFINGGWSMNDEATCHYNSIIDQMTLGLRRLKETFGKCGIPKVAWQIDPFGHSREQASLFAGMNFDAVYFAREDYEDQALRRKEKRLEHVWIGSDDLGGDGDIFTGMMDMGYGPPSQFNWNLIDSQMSDPIVDNTESEEYNVPKRVQDLVDFAKSYSQGYATNQILVPMGSDFHYQDAHVYFKNMDKLIKHANALSKDVKVFYSTPSCYTKALHDMNRTWTTKSDDYFPYASDAHAYWTGFYTSRPALKRFERVGNNVLQACKQVDVLAGNDGKFEERINKLKETMGVMQHHDAVTGTEKQHVANNYAKHLDSSIAECTSVMHESFVSKLLPISSSSIPPKLKQEFCPELNVSSCAVTELGQDFIVQLYNPIGHLIKGRLIRLPVDGKLFYEILGPKNEAINGSLIPILPEILALPERISKSSKATHELVFQANLPALGLTTYFIKVSKAQTSGSIKEAKLTKISKETTVKSKNFDVTFDATGLLSHATLKDGRKILLNSEFRLYRSNHSWGERESGAYVFRPSVDQKTYPVGNISEAILVETLNGIYEIHQRFNGSYISQVIRIDPFSDHLEFDWIVGPIPVAKDNVPKEIIHRFSAPELANNRIFYTDANGRQMLKRIRNFRPTWNLTVQEPVSGNYYPVNSRIFLRDEKQGLQLTVLNDRAQGGSSVEDGALELMVHRRLIYDDGFGVGEALDEPSNGEGLIVRGRHFLLLDLIKESSRKHRQLGQQLYMEPVISFTTGITVDDYRKHFRTEVSGLTNALPGNVHLLTLEQWSEGEYLIRLEHFYQKNEDAELSKPVKLSLGKLFSGFDIVLARELTLGANQDVDAKKSRFKFNYVGKVESTEEKFDVEKLEVTLSPMQIKTFVVKTNRVKSG